MLCLEGLEAVLPSCATSWATLYAIVFPSKNKGFVLDYRFFSQSFSSSFHEAFSEAEMGRVAED